MDTAVFEKGCPTGGPHKQRVWLYRGMFKLKLEINVNLPQLLSIVVSVALNGEFERFGGFCVDCYYTSPYNV